MGSNNSQDKQPVKILVNGIIGIGKTTAIKYVSFTLGKECYVMPEIYDKNALEMFYNDPQKEAFNFQMSMLNGRIEQDKKARKECGENTEFILGDRGFLGDLIFMELQFSLGNISHTQRAAYLEIWDAYYDTVKNGLIVVHISDKTSKCISNINERGEAFEISKVDMRYLELLEAKHLEVYKKLDIIPIEICMRKVLGNIWFGEELLEIVRKSRFQKEGKEEDVVLF